MRYCMLNYSLNSHLTNSLALSVILYYYIIILLPGGSIFEIYLLWWMKKAGWCHSGVYEKEYLYPDNVVKTTRPNTTRGDEGTI